MKKKKILFTAFRYWEITWMYNVIKALNAPVYADYSSIINHLNSLNFNHTEDFDSGDILVTCFFHFSENYHLIKHYLKQNKEVILLQYAWDSQINLIPNYWGRDMSKFSVYLVGSSQDETWLTDKFGQDKIIYTGMPRLDDIHRVRQMTKKQLKPIYKLVGSNRFFLADLPLRTIYTEEIEKSYLKLPDLSPIPIVYKYHPGGASVTDIKNIDEFAPNNTYLEDDPLDPLFTYKLIKASQGIITIDSFMAIEASLLGKPVIRHADYLLPPRYFESPDRRFTQDRLPPAMFSPLNNPQFTTTQKKVASWYKCDGNNTSRVVDILKLAQKVN